MANKNGSTVAELTTAELQARLANTDTMLRVFKLLGKADKDGTTIPAIHGKIPEVTAPLTIKYHLGFLIAHNLCEQNGVVHTGVKGQPPKCYRITRSGRSMLERLTMPKAASKPRAKKVEAAAEATVEQKAA